MDLLNVPIRYIPKKLSKTDLKKQKQYLRKSRKLYKKGIYYQRPKVKSFKSKPSHHIENARKIYKIDVIEPSNELSEKTQCSREALEKIVNKGRGAYYSSGSRPNQTAESWGLARLASAITGGKSSIIDYDILYNGCSANSKALKMATDTCKKQKKCKKYTQRKQPKMKGGYSNIKDILEFYEENSSNENIDEIINNFEKNMIKIDKQLLEVIEQIVSNNMKLTNDFIIYVIKSLINKDIIDIDNFKKSQDYDIESNITNESFFTLKRSYEEKKDLQKTLINAFLFFVFIYKNWKNKVITDHGPIKYYISPLQSPVSPPNIHSPPSELLLPPPVFSESPPSELLLPPPVFSESPPSKKLPPPFPKI
jgi:hypothetical protein